MKLIKLIPVKQLAKFLPDILAYVLTKALGYVLTKYPSKAHKVLETAEQISKAMHNSIVIARDGVITKEEIAVQKALWREVFK